MRPGAIAEGLKVAGCGPSASGRFRPIADVGVPAISDIQMKLGVPTQVLADGDLAYETVPGVVTLKGS